MAAFAWMYQITVEPLPIFWRCVHFQFFFLFSWSLWYCLCHLLLLHEPDVAGVICKACDPPWIQDSWKSFSELIKRMKTVQLANNWITICRKMLMVKFWLILGAIFFFWKPIKWFVLKIFLPGHFVSVLHRRVWIILYTSLFFNMTTIWWITGNINVLATAYVARWGVKCAFYSVGNQNFERVTFQRSNKSANVAAVGYLTSGAYYATRG